MDCTPARRPRRSLGEVDVPSSHKNVAVERRRASRGSAERLADDDDAKEAEARCSGKAEVVDHSGEAAVGTREASCPAEAAEQTQGNELAPVLVTHAEGGDVEFEVDGKLFRVQDKTAFDTAAVGGASAAPKQKPKRTLADLRRAQRLRAAGGDATPSGTAASSSARAMGMMPPPAPPGAWSSLLASSGLVAGASIAEELAEEAEEASRSCKGAGQAQKARLSAEAAERRFASGKGNELTPVLVTHAEKGDVEFEANGDIFRVQDNAAFEAAAVAGAAAAQAPKPKRSLADLRRAQRLRAAGGDATSSPAIASSLAPTIPSPVVAFSSAPAADMPPPPAPHGAWSSLLLSHGLVAGTSIAEELAEQEAAPGSEEARQRATEGPSAAEAAEKAGAGGGELERVLVTHAEGGDVEFEVDGKIFRVQDKAAFDAAVVAGAGAARHQGAKRSLSDLRRAQRLRAAGGGAAPSAPCAAAVPPPPAPRGVWSSLLERHGLVAGPSIMEELAEGVMVS